MLDPWGRLRVRRQVLRKRGPETGKMPCGAADTVITIVERRLRARVRIVRENESFENIVV